MALAPPPLLPSLLTTSPSDWRYTAEGGANLVLSYVGPRTSPFSGKLLRLRKKKRHPSSAGAIPDEVGIEFGERIIAPLLGEGQVVRMEKMEIVEEWLADVKEMLDESGVRPKARQEEDEIDVEKGIVVLAEDLVHGEGVLAIEIKPKWGFLPSPKYLSSDTRDTKANYCRFCMHTFMKNAPEKGVEAALADRDEGYCPLDLFSTDEERVSAAIAGLWHGWEKSRGKANNLRFFYEGKRIEPRDTEAFTELSIFLASVTPSAPSDSTTLSLLSSAVVPVLLSSRTLPTLSTLQSTLDPLDIEGIAKHLSTTDSIDLSSLDADLSHLGTQPTIDEWTAWLAAHSATSPTSPNSSTRSIILSYLLSATFKDCSVFLRLTRDGQGSVVKAIDLDPKPLDRLAKYYALDQKIVKTWKEMMEERERKGEPEPRRCRA